MKWKPLAVLLLGSAMIAGCGGGGGEEGPSRQPSAGLYAGTAKVTLPRSTGLRDYVSLAQVAADGSVEILSVREPKDEEEFDIFTYFLSAGTAERREAQITFGQYVSSTGEGTARPGNDARFTFEAEGVSLDLTAAARSLPEPGPGRELREGSYQGEVYLIDQDGRVGGFGTVQGRLVGRRLTADHRIATRRTGVFGGTISADLQANGSTNAALQIGLEIITSGVTWSGDGSTVTIRYENERGETKALFELRRR